MKQFGSRYYGSSEIKTSVAEEEIVPQGVSLYKISLHIENDTTVSINDSEPIFLKGGMGFSSEQNDAMIWSLKILDDGVSYFWVGGA